MNKPRIALVHDWLIDKGGAEKVLESLIDIYPDADVYTLLYDEEGPCKSFLAGTKNFTSRLQRLPGAVKRYRSLLAFMPIAIEQFDLSSYDIVLSSSHAVAKGVITGPDQLHISYVHTPIRYAWDLTHQYLRDGGYSRGIKGYLAKLVMHYIRIWDARTSNGVDNFIANSHFISRRIWKAYHRESTVIYPPVDIDAFTMTRDKGDYYLAASRMVSYKKLDLIVKAFNEMPEKELIVIGDGPEKKKLEKLASPNTKILDYQNFESYKSYLEKAKAYIFAGEEDFGIMPVEAQAAGTPVIAYGKGGVLETVIQGKTGLFFEEQTSDSLIDVINAFEESVDQFYLHDYKQNIEKFNIGRFKEEIRDFVSQQWEGVKSKLNSSM